MPRSTNPEATATDPTATNNEGDTNMDATETTTTADTASTNGSTDPAAALKEKDVETIAAPIPVELKNLITKAADDAHKSNAALVREILAAHFSYTIPDDFASRATLTDEEKKQKVRDRNDMVKKLLAAVRNGKLVISDTGEVTFNG